MNVTELLGTVRQQATANLKFWTNADPDVCRKLSSYQVNTGSDDGKRHHNKWSHYLSQCWPPFSRVVITFLWIRSTTTRNVWIIPSFWILGLCAACWAHFMCHYELWPTSVNHPFSSLNSSLGLAGGKCCQEITIHIFRLFILIG